jgi:ABC-type amino acid transport substrate-binding protein
MCPAHERAITEGGQRKMDLYVIFSKQRVTAEFVARFSEALRRFKQTPTFRAICQKYFPDAPPSPKR